MKKIFAAAVVLLTTMTFVSCSPSIEGNWEEKTTKITMNLYKDGSLSVSGSPYTEWQKDGDNLILTIKNEDSSSSDTFEIKQLTKTDMVLAQDGYELEFVRK